MSDVFCDSSDTISNVALCGHLQAFKYLFNTSENINQDDESKSYYLAHNAAASGNLTLLTWTFKNTKCKVTDQDSDGMTILHVAALTSNLNIIEWILKYTHLSPVIRTAEGATALHFACWSGNIEIIKLLIETEPRLINMRMVNGATAAMYAAQGGFIDIMECLLNEGANFGLPTVNGVNCLHMVAHEGKLEAVKWLVENTGLPLNGKDDNGITPIHYAAINDRHDVVRWLLEKEIQLLKERFNLDTEESVSVYDSSRVHSIEDLVSSAKNLSVSHISKFAVLENVEEKLTLILSEYRQSSDIKIKDDEIDGLSHCLIPINVLLLLQSAVVELRSQYQRFLRQSYLSDSIISEETQTLDFINYKETNIPQVQIPRPKTYSFQPVDIQYINDNLIPPPPSVAPQLQVYKKQIVQKYNNDNRRGSSTDDLKKSLIQELKKINTIRSRNESVASFQNCDLSLSYTDTSSLKETNFQNKYNSRKSITDSAPNLLSIFNTNTASPLSTITPKWKNESLTNKGAPLKDKEEESVIPNWKLQILEKRKLCSGTNKGETQTTNAAAVKDITISPNTSKVSQLVNQYQNNFL